MTANILTLNCTKTEFLVSALQQQLHKMVSDTRRSAI